MQYHDSFNPKVAVLISTYNGEKYLRDQLESLRSQDYGNFAVFVRDDGSVDDTENILTEYKNKGMLNKIDDNNGNLGPGKSFLTLAASVDADIYMFCDQDDVWLDNKISKTVEEIRVYGFDLPVLFCSDLMVVDNNVKLIHKSFLTLEGINKPKALHLKVLAVQNSVVGCTVAFTNSLKQKIYQTNILDFDIAMHDWWFAMYAVCLGKLIYYHGALILYRQHDKNVSGANTNSFFGRFIRFNFKQRVSKLRIYKSRVAKQALSFLSAYEPDLSLEQRSTLLRISKISGGYWFISWVNCLIHGTKFDNVHMNLAFLLFPPMPNK